MGIPTFGIRIGIRHSTFDIRRHSTFDIRIGIRHWQSAIPNSLVTRHSQIRQSSIGNLHWIR